MEIDYKKLLQLDNSQRSEFNSLLQLQQVVVGFEPWLFVVSFRGLRSYKKRMTGCFIEHKIK